MPHPSAPLPAASSRTSLPLSVFIIAKNEAARIGHVLQEACKLSDDVIVIDSGSTDGTQHIAESYGARVLYNPWPGYGEQKRFGEEQCRHNWVLNLDADEVLTAPLIEEIQNLWANGEPEADGYHMAIAEVFPTETEPHRFAFAMDPVRLYRLDKGRYVTSTVHDRVKMAPDALIKRLKGRVHHFSVQSFEAQLDKLNRYTTAQVADRVAQGKSFSSLRLFTEFPVSFLKAYFIRRHFLRGRYGFMVAMNYAYFRYLRVAKYMEYRITPPIKER